MRLYEVTDCLTRQATMRCVHVRAGADVEKELRQAQQAAANAIMPPARGAQAYFESKADAVNKEATKTFEDHCYRSSPRPDSTGSGSASS